VCLAGVGVERGPRHPLAPRPARAVHAACADTAMDARVEAVPGRRRKVPIAAALAAALVAALAVALAAALASLPSAHSTRTALAWPRSARLSRPSWRYRDHVALCTRLGRAHHHCGLSRPPGWPEDLTDLSRSRPPGLSAPLAMKCCRADASDSVEPVAASR
jgi:hypothetical protein